MNSVNAKDVRRVWNSSFSDDPRFHHLDASIYDNAPQIARHVNDILFKSSRYDVENVIIEVLTEEVK